LNKKTLLIFACVLKHLGETSGEICTAGATITK